MMRTGFTEEDTMARLWPEARLSPHRHYKWRGTRAELTGRLGRLGAEGKWLLFDPASRMAGTSGHPESLWTLHVAPPELARALHLASPGFQGAILVDLSSLNGLWGRRGPHRELWMPIWLLCQQFTVVECEIAGPKDPG